MGWRRREKLAEWRMGRKINEVIADRREMDTFGWDWFRKMKEPGRKKNTVNSPHLGESEWPPPLPQHIACRLFELRAQWRQGMCT